MVGVLQQRLDPLAFALGMGPRFLGLRRALADQRLELLVLHLQQPAGPRQRRDLRLRAGEERIGERRGTGERREDRADQPLPVALDTGVALDEPGVFLGDEGADRVPQLFHQRLAGIGAEERQRLVELSAPGEPDALGHLLALAVDLAAQARDDRLLFRALWRGGRRVRRSYSSIEPVACS